MDNLPTTFQLLKSLYQTPLDPSLPPRHPVLDDPWYIVAAVAFNAARKPNGVVSVYQYVLEDLKNGGFTSTEDHVTLVEKLQEALLHASVTNGIPRAVVTVLQLNSVVPQFILDRVPPSSRDRTVSVSDLEKRGRDIIKEMFGEERGDKLQKVIDSSGSDIGMFDTVSYSLLLGQTSVLSPLEAAYVFVTAGIFNDFPREVSWYYLNALQQGATVEEVKAIRDMALKVASLTKFTLHEEVPEVVDKEVLHVY